MNKPRKSTETKSGGSLPSLLGVFLLGGLMLSTAILGYRKYASTGSVFTGYYTAHGDEAILALIALATGSFVCFVCFVGMLLRRVRRQRRGGIEPEFQAVRSEGQSEEKEPSRVSGADPAPHSIPSPRPSAISSLLGFLSKPSPSLSDPVSRQSTPKRRRRPAPSYTARRHRRRSMGSRYA